MKRIVCALLAFCLLLPLLSGCGGKPETREQKLRIVTTIFPLYDWTKNLLGDRADEVTLTMLLDDGVDMHSFQPSVADMVTVSDCDLLIYVGGESDEWIEDALQDKSNSNRIALNLMDVLSDRALEEELVEGMEGEADGAKDEHIWLSLQNAGLLCEAIRDALIELDAGHASAYEAACADYIARLQALDGEYREAVDGARLHTLLFADRFPFRYLTEDYGLAYYAAFAGCSSETEASFATVVFLAGKVSELDLRAICVIENSDGKLAQTVMENAGGTELRVLTLHSMQGAVGSETYLSLMEKNLQVLQEALS